MPFFESFSGTFAKRSGQSSPLLEVLLVAGGAAGGNFIGGGGAGGGFVYGPRAGNGGSGIVIIRYSSAYPALSSTSGSPSIVVANGYRTYTWTTSGSYSLTY